MPPRKAKTEAADKATIPDSVLGQLDYFARSDCPLTETAKVCIWLEDIAVDLESYPEAGWVSMRLGEKGKESAEAAITAYKRLELALYDAETRLASLPDSDQARQIKMALMTIDSALSDSDGLAEIALGNGHRRAAIQIIRAAFQRAYEQAGYGLRWMASELAVYGEQTAGLPDREPGDPITSDIVKTRYRVSERTLLRRVRDGKLKSYRATQTGQHIFSEADIAGRYQRIR